MTAALNVKVVLLKGTESETSGKEAIIKKEWEGGFTNPCCGKEHTKDQRTKKKKENKMQREEIM